eukprot:266378_1
MPQFTTGHSIRADWITEQQEKHKKYVDAGRKGGKQKTKNIKTSRAATELSNLLHTIPANPQTEEQKLPTPSINPLYQYDVSRMSKRAREIHRSTINNLNNSQSTQEISTETIHEKFRNFMEVENKPHSIQTAKEKFNINITHEQSQSMLEHLANTKFLSRKQFENGQILYWKSQTVICIDEAIEHKYKELATKKQKFQILQKKKAALELIVVNEKLLQLQKYVSTWKFRKMKTLDIIDEVFETFHTQPIEILSTILKCETDTDNNVDIKNYEMLLNQFK